MQQTKSDSVEEVYAPRNSLVMEEVRVGHVTPSRNSVTMEDAPPEREPSEASGVQSKASSAENSSTSRNSVTMTEVHENDTVEVLSFEERSQSLESKLKSRPPSGELEQNNIIKGSLNVSPTILATQQELKFKQTQISLERKLRSRPNSEELQQVNIIKDESTSSFNERQGTLQSKLSSETRPMIDDLVRMNILKEIPFVTTASSKDVADSDKAVTNHNDDEAAIALVDPAAARLPFHRQHKKAHASSNNVNTSTATSTSKNSSTPNSNANANNNHGNNDNVPTVNTKESQASSDQDVFKIPSSRPEKKEPKGVPHKTGHLVAPTQKQ